jgi:hypothetical protein
MPIIHVIGLPGAGKTVLVRRLSKTLKLPVFCIGEYRKKHPQTPLGEIDAWLALYKDLSKRKWTNCILETTGLNARESFLRTLPFGQVIAIKLLASRPVLYKRIKFKKKGEQGGNWLFSSEYKDKQDFVRKMFKNFSQVSSGFWINTNQKTTLQIYKEALNYVSKFL